MGRAEKQEDRRTGWGSPERGGCIHETAGRAGAPVVQGELLLPPVQHRDSMGCAGEQRITGWGGTHSPSVSLGLSPLLYSRARQAAEMGKREHSTVASVASCPQHPCQVLTET